MRQLTTRAFPTAQTDVFKTLAREAFLRGCLDADAAKMALFWDPQTLNQAVQYTQTATHNHKLLARQGRSRVRHVSFGPTEPPAVKQIQVKQTGPDQLDVHLDWSDLNKNVRELVTCLKGPRPQSGKKKTTA